MAHERRGQGFERAGAGGPQTLGLPAARAAGLRLAVAFREAAGPALARRATALHVRSGVLEVEVTDPRWTRAISELLPRLAARVAGRDRSLGVRRCRLIVRDGDAVQRGAAREISDEPGEERRDPRGCAAREDPAPCPVRPSRAEIESRLRSAAERWLARAGG